MDLETSLREYAIQWDLAMERNIAEEIAEFLSPDWVIVGTGGGISPKDSFLGEIKNGNLSHSRMDMDEFRIRIYGNTGLLTAKGTSAGLYKGKAFDLYEWSTSVFIYSGTAWTCVLTMLTPV